MAKVTKPAAPDRLTMSLFAPGMTALHRAGLGGLACTLKALERHHEAGLLRADKLPGPLEGDEYPWEVTADTVTLKFGTPEKAGDYLKKLFAFAFQVTDTGLIYLPGQHRDRPSDAVLADLQLGFTLTFLQHGKVRSLEKQPTVASYDTGGDGTPGVVVEYRKCSGYKHQGGWEELVDKNGCLITGPVTVDGPISPGTVIRHVAFTGDTRAEDPPARMLPLYFALVGCLSLPVNRGVAALVVPGVEDLREFVFDRPAMTPGTAVDCQIANAADAAFRSQVRLRRSHRRDAEVKASARRLGGTTCDTMTFTPTPWASQQKSRVATLRVPAGEDRLLDRFELAAGHLPPRVVTRTVTESVGRGKQKATTERQESFRSDSVVRPLVAENLALGRKWYAGFAALMTRINPATDKPFRNQLPFERGGLHAMTADDKMWDEPGERLVVRAVHEAMRRRYAQIADENEGNKAGMGNRMERFVERLRLALAGAKREADVRFALTDLFSRAGNLGTLRDGWQPVLAVLRKDWQLARDLGLLALASYSGPAKPADANTAPQPADKE